MAIRRRGAKKIDFTHWTGFKASVVNLAAGTNGVNIFAGQHLPETLLRTRGQLSAVFDGVLAGTGVTAEVGVGMILVPDGSGTTVTWSPLADPEAPWFWYSSFFLDYEEQVADVIGSPMVSAYRETIDSKAMRVVRSDTEVQLVFEQVATQGTGPVKINVNGRILSGT